MPTKRLLLSIWVLPSSAVVKIPPSLPSYSFCGTTSDFCGTGCQAGYGSCGDVQRPSCGTGDQTTVSGRAIGYYESWASTRSCQAVMPEGMTAGLLSPYVLVLTSCVDINLDPYTHLNFAFASFNPAAPFEIAPPDTNTGALFNRFTSLKSKKKGLQTWISVGGWAFSDPGPTHAAFSDMTNSSTNRQQFISGLSKFLNTYGFDGVDIDWVSTFAFIQCRLLCSSHTGISRRGRPRRQA